MAQIKKNQLAQVLFPMVDSVDFATVESALTVLPTAKFYGVNHGGSAAMTSGTISKAVSHVHSGLFRMTMKAAETNYDYVLYRVIQASCADQILTFHTVDNDDSDLMSALTVIQSMASDAASAAVQANSRVLLNQSRISDTYSMLSDFLSDFQSRVPKAVATNSQLSDLVSDLVSDLRSFIGAGVPADASTMSDLRSAITAGPTPVITASDISDIASAVWAAKYTAHSAASSFGSLFSDIYSRLVLNQSRISDTYSMLSDLQSDFQSRVPKAVATSSQLSDLASDIVSDLRSFIGAGVPADASTMSDLRSAITATELDASDLSDIASAVWVNAIGARVDSRVLLNQSRISDTYSMLSDFLSDFQSRVPKRVATDSQLSDLASDLRSYLVGMSATVSDVYSLVSNINSLAVNNDAAHIFRRNTTPSVVADGSVIKFDAAANATNDFYNQAQVLLVGGTGAGQGPRLIVDYIGATKKATVKPAWVTNPDATTSFLIRANAPWLSNAHSDLRSQIAGLPTSAVVSDIYSMLSDLVSDFQSRVPKAVATNSQLSDLVSDLRSLIGAGVPADASTMSDLRSAITAGHAVTASDISDIASAVWAHVTGTRVDSRVLLNQSRISDTYSMLSDLQSDFQSRVPKRVATDSQLSDALSDIKSAVAGVTATVSASDISDIASAVKATLASDISDIFSAATQTNSRVLLNQSRVSDVYSLLSDLQSDFQSRVPKAVATQSLLSDVSSDLRSLIGAGVALDASTLSDLRSAITATELDASDLSDIASAVWAAKYTAHSAASSFGSLLSDISSRVLLNQSRVSDIYSMLSDVQSDFQSRVPKRVATDSQLSDLHSDLRSFLVVMSGIQSDVYSALSDFVSDFGSALAEPTTAPAAAATIKQAIAWAHALNRNKITQTATVQSLRNDGDTAGVASAAVSDDGTVFTRSKWGN